MGKKKKSKQEAERRKKEELANIPRKGRCLKCGKPMIKNHKSCKACSRKDRLRSKANRRGKDRNYYLSKNEELKW
jgi:uncharacterized OB-fold protein